MVGHTSSGLRGLLHRGSTYLLSNVIVQAGSLVTFPLYARSLGPSGYGALALLLALTSVLSTILILGLNTAVTRTASLAGEDETRAAGTALLYVSATGALLCAITAVVRDPLMALVAPDMSSTTSWVMPLAMAYVTLTAMLQVVLAQAVARNRAAVYLTAAILTTAVTLGAAIVLVGLLDGGVGGVVVALTCGALAALVFTAPRVLHSGWARFSPPLLHAMLAFGIGLVPMNLAAWGLDLADRYILSHYVPMAEVGRYSAAYKVGTLAMMGLVIPFRTAFQPFLFRADKRADGPVVIGQVVRLFIIASLWCALAVSVIGPELLRVLAGPAYVSASYIVPWIAAGSVMVGLTTAFVAGILLRDKTYLGAISYGVAAAFNIGLNFVLIPRYGALGAAVATLVADSLLAVVFVGISEWLYRTPVDFPRIAVCVAWLGVAAVVCVAASRGLDGSPFDLPVRLAVLLGFAASCVWAGGLTAGERHGVNAALLSLRGAAARLAGKRS
jgi:O-antigen/teichoic acid export membrane protein